MSFPFDTAPIVTCKGVLQEVSEDVLQEMIKTVDVSWVHEKGGVEGCVKKPCPCASDHVYTG